MPLRDDVPGLVAQGCSIAETIEIARDIARKLVEAQAEDAVQIALASNNGQPRDRTNNGVPFLSESGAGRASGSARLRIILALIEELDRRPFELTDEQLAEVRRRRAD